MITNAYSIFDTKSLIFNVPWFQPTDGAATRVLMDLVNDTGTTIGRHPADYVLYHIGNYNDATGFMEAQTPRRHIIDAVALLREQPAPLFSPNVTNSLNNGAK